MRPGRARAGIVLLAALALASLSFPPARGSPYHEYDASLDVSGAASYAIETNRRAAQSFVPTGDFTLTRVGLYVLDAGRNDDLSVSIVPDAGGVPSTTTVLGAAVNNTAGAYQWANFTLSAPVPVAAGVRYWIVADDNAGTGEGYEWRYVATDSYPRGNASTSASGTWTVQPGDFAFQLYGWTPANVTANVTADRASVAGGDPVSFTIRLANAGTEDATDVWVNATLDPRLRFASGGPAPVAVVGPLVTFRPASIPNGTSDLYLNATAEGILEDGGTLVLPVTVEFSDGAGRLGLAASAAVGTRAPRVTVAVNVLSVTTNAVEPGALVTYEVTASNEGQAGARHVWLNETLHRVLTYLNDTAPSAPAVDGEHQSWHFVNMNPGAMRFNVTVQVDPRAAGDTVVATFLSVAFTDAAGYGLAQGRSNTIVFRVVGAGSGETSNPWLWGSFAISATIVGGTYLGYARRRLRTEEIFLIHHSGVLLVHMSKTMKADHDRDIVSGMLTAILNFVQDAFHYEERQELHGLDLGEYRVHVRKGSITYLALVFRGKPTRWLAKTAARAVSEIEAEWGDMLRDWDGDVRALAGVRAILKGHFLSPTGPSRSWARLRALFAHLDQTFKPMRPL